MVWLFKTLDFLHVPGLFLLIWHLLTRITILTQQEKEVAISVLGEDSISYSAVRVAQGRILKIIFKLNKGRPFATFYTINLPESGSQARANLGILVHELVHVFQYKRVGSVYIWEALCAQWGEGYSYGGWQKLLQDREKGKHFREYNREQQGKIAEDYYNEVVKVERPIDDEIRQAYEPFIEELRNGDL